MSKDTKDVLWILAIVAIIIYFFCRVAYMYGSIAGYSEAVTDREKRDCLTFTNEPIDQVPVACLQYFNVKN